MSRTGLYGLLITLLILFIAYGAFLLFRHQGRLISARVEEVSK